VVGDRHNEEEEEEEEEEGKEGLCEVLGVWRMGVYNTQNKPDEHTKNQYTSSRNQLLIFNNPLNSNAASSTPPPTP